MEGDPGTWCSYLNHATIDAAKLICGARVWDLPGYYLDGIFTITTKRRVVKRQRNAQHALYMMTRRQKLRGEEVTT